jgi:hypothetical protein
MNNSRGLTKCSTWPLQVHYAAQQRLKTCILLTLLVLGARDKGRPIEVGCETKPAMLGKVGGADVIVRRKNLLGTALILFKRDPKLAKRRPAKRYRTLCLRDGWKVHLAVKASDHVSLSPSPRSKTYPLSARFALGIQVGSFGEYDTLGRQERLWLN